MNTKRWVWAGVALAPLALGGCNPKVTIEPIEVKPIHLTLDINIKVDRELDRFFDFQDQPATGPGAKDAQTPATAPAQGGM